jgi:hypothetical protein
VALADEDRAFDQLANQAIHSLGSFLDGSDHTKEDIGVARIASSVISAWTRHKQTEGAREATTFMMARELANDSETLARYLAVALPKSPVMRAIGQPAA